MGWDPTLGFGYSMAFEEVVYHRVCHAPRALPSPPSGSRRNRQPLHMATPSQTLMVRIMSNGSRLIQENHCNFILEQLSYKSVSTNQLAG